MSAPGVFPTGVFRVVLLTLFASLMATFVKILFHEEFYDYVAHPYVALVFGAIGFLVSILTLVISLKYLKGGWRVTAVIGSLLTAYWWFSDIASRVMAK
jgi:hypothetical protein